MATRDDAKPLGLVALKEGDGSGEYHFEKCNKLWRGGGYVKPVKPYWSKGEAEREGLHFCDVCRRNEEKFLFRVKEATRPMPGAEIRPREKTFFSRYDALYHYRTDCPVWTKSLREKKMLEKAFPIKYYEDRDDAEMFDCTPCPECARRGDPDVPG